MASDQSDLGQPVQGSRRRLLVLTLLLAAVLAGGYGRRAWLAARDLEEGPARSEQLLEEGGAFVRQYDDGLTYVALGNCHFDRRGQIHDHVMAKLRCFPRIFLDARTTPINDDAILQLARLGCVEGLNISETAITSAGLRHVGTMTGLQGLNLSLTRATDDDVVHLTRLEHLQVVHLRGTAISDAGFQRLAAELPGCTIEH